MGAEDFSFMLNARPGAFIFVGNGDSAGLHHPAYNFNDEVIPVGTSYWVKLVETALRGVSADCYCDRSRPAVLIAATRSRRLLHRLGCFSARRLTSAIAAARCGSSRQSRVSSARQNAKSLSARAFERRERDRRQERQALHHQHHARRC